MTDRIDLATPGEAAGATKEVTAYSLIQPEDAPRSAAYIRTARALRNRGDVLREMGVALPDASAVSLRSTENAEDWINEASDHAEREARYEYAETLWALELLEEKEARVREQETDLDPDEVRREAKRVVTRRMGERVAAEWEATHTAGEWFGETGEDFDPDVEERRPCYLEVEPGSYVFAPGVNYLFGPRSATKTWLSYFAALQEVRKGRKVLLIDMEMDKRTALRRLHTLGLSRDEIASGRVVYVHPSGAISDAARGQLLRRFEDGPPSLVVIDSSGMATAASGLNSNDDTDMAQWALDVPFWMKEQWSEACVLVIDHVSKANAGGGATDPIGSQRKGASADGLYSCQVISPISRTVRGAARLTVHKDRTGFLTEGKAVADYEFGGGGPFAVRPVNSSVVLLPANVAQLVNDQRRIAEYVGDRHPDKVSVEVARMALGIHPAEFTKMKDLLIADDVLVQNRGLAIGPKFNEWINGSDD